MMIYEIYQVKRSLMRDYGFLGYEEAIKLNGEGSVKKENYRLVYKYEGDEMSLEDLYCIFNLERPSDFMGHSMSVSDVVKNEDGYWYCDSFGWKKIWGGEE
jgi:hypothetical protein